MTRKQRRAAKREYDAQRYQERLAGPLCLRCPKPKEPDSSYCADCGPTVLAAARAQMKERRAQLRDAGCCDACGRPKGKTVVPLPLGAPARWHTEGRKPKVRVAITEGDGRTRYRSIGQGRRGRITHADNDEQDTKLVQRELEAAAAALAYAHSPEVKAMPRIQARDILHAALSRLHLVQRLLGEILSRHKYVR